MAVLEYKGEKFFTKDKMTDAERLTALMTGQPVDRISVSLLAEGYSSTGLGKGVFEYYDDMKWALESQIKINEKFGAVPMALLGWPCVGPWEFGGDIKWPHGEYAQCPSPIRSVQTPDDAMKLEMPDIDTLKTLGYIPRYMEAIKLGSEARYPSVPAMYGVWTTAGNILSFDNLCKWTYKYPEVVHHMLRLSTDFLIAVYRILVDIGDIQYMMVGNSMAGAANDIISPKTLDEFVMPYTKEFHEALFGMGFPTIFLHLCGEQNATYPALKKANVPIAKPESPILPTVSVSHLVDLEYAESFYPDAIIYGNIEPAKFQIETPEQIYELCRIAIEKGKKHKNGFILAPGCEMPPMTPEDNIWAMIRAASDFGYYD